MPREQVELVKKYCGVDALVDALSQHVVAGNVSFPFKRHFVGDARAMFERLRSYKPNERHEAFTIPNVRFYSGNFFDFRFDRNEFVCIYEAASDYGDIDVLVDIFQVFVAARTATVDMRLTNLDRPP